MLFLSNFSLNTEFKLNGSIIKFSEKTAANRASNIRPFLNKLCRYMLAPKIENTEIQKFYSYP